MRLALTLFTVLFSFNALASLSSMKRIRARAEAHAKAYEACTKATQEIQNEEVTCAEDTEYLLKVNYPNYLANGMFDDCINSNIGTLQERALQDFINNKCMWRAELKHPELAKKLRAKYQKDKNDTETSLFFRLSLVLGIIFLIAILTDYNKNKT